MPEIEINDLSELQTTPGPGQNAVAPLNDHYPPLPTPRRSSIVALQKESSKSIATVGNVSMQP